MQSALTKIAFTKMHGLGNDFIVIDAINQAIELTPELVRRLADRHFGIGCDQLLVVEAPDLPEVDFKYRIFNHDGSEVEQCGNGVRCFARFVLEKGLTDKKEIAVSTCSGIVYPRVESDLVRVDMGAPNFEPASLPLAADLQDRYLLLVDGREIEFGAVSMGNPHAVIVVDDVDTAPIEAIGAAIQRDELFPQSVNVGFLQILNRAEARLRVYERGVGETKACGTGACGAMAVANHWGLLDTQATLHLSGGDLHLEWNGPGQSVVMTGPATTVYEGIISV